MACRIKSVDPKKGAIAIWCSSKAMSDLQYELSLGDDDEFYIPRNIEEEETKKRVARGSKVLTSFSMTTTSNDLRKMFVHEQTVGACGMDGGRRARRVYRGSMRACSIVTGFLMRARF